MAKKKKVSKNRKATRKTSPNSGRRASEANQGSGSEARGKKKTATTETAPTTSSEITSKGAREAAAGATDRHSCGLKRLQVFLLFKVGNHQRSRPLIL